MSISFTQSMQALHTDHGRSSLVGLSIASALLVCWLLWFFTPSLTVYASGHLSKLTRNDTLLALLPAQEQENLHVGQVAHLYLPDAVSAARSLPATVLAVASQPTGEQIQIVLYPESNANLKQLFATDATGEVYVEVAKISPAVLFLRASGLSIETPPVSVSPQQ